MAEAVKVRDGCAGASEGGHCRHHRTRYSKHLPAQWWFAVAWSACRTQRAAETEQPSSFICMLIPLPTAHQTYCC